MSRVEEVPCGGLVVDMDPVELAVQAYLPKQPAGPTPRIAVIACGSITEYHVRAYRSAGYEVAVFCDVDRARAEARRDQFYPCAAVTTDYREVLRREDIGVVDVATHPAERAEIIAAAIAAGKHVLSQKPFALDLAVARSLADLAETKGLKLAINQNARWAPHFSYMRHAVHSGAIGEVVSADFLCHFDHNWIAGTPFDSVKHVILYDFAVHWFDIACVFFGKSRPAKVSAAIHKSPTQRASPPLLGHVMIEFDTGQSTMIFNGDCRFGCLDMTHVIGSDGTLRSSGSSSISEQTVTLYTSTGVVSPKLQGTWYTNGFHGAMAELLSAIEEDREPSHSARNNIRTLELCFAAVASAESGKPEVPGSVAKMPG